MVRIGIIGSDNSHAIAFSRLFNRPEEGAAFVPDDYKVVALYGRDPERNREVAEAGAIETIVEKPEDMLGKVDAVMVVFRHGDLHARHALPFIEAGIPTWVDKPFAIKVEDARAMIEAAEKHGTPLTGGSTLKHALDTVAVKELLVSRRAASFLPLEAATINYYASFDNEYGGFPFYGSHLAELTMFLFGYDACAVLATEHRGNVTAVLKYSDYHVVMNFLDKAQNNPYVLVFGQNGTVLRQFDHSTGYREGVRNFLRMLETRRPPLPYDHLLKPVALLKAIERSLQENREVELEEVL